MGESFGESRAERIREQTVGVFGGQGHFGSSFSRRLAEIHPTWHVIPTSDKEHNQEIASGCDTVFVSVRPEQVEPLLAQIAGDLKPEAHVVSFAARYPLTTQNAFFSRPIREILQKPAARFLADPWWNIAASYRDATFEKDKFETLMGSVTRIPPIEMSSDREIDAFSVHLSHIIVALCAKRLGTMPAAAEHLSFVSDQLKIPVEALEEFVIPGEPADILKRAATPGGITEALLAGIEKTPDTGAAELHAAVIKKFRL